VIFQSVDGLATGFVATGIEAGFDRDARNVALALLDAVGPLNDFNIANVARGRRAARVLVDAAIA
tara:strand:- start:794 stop:988 length:195 start_codon:yes stop_codon:yes gene_type:complete